MPAMGQALEHTNMKSPSPPRICTPVKCRGQQLVRGPSPAQPYACSFTAYELRDIFTVLYGF